MTPVGLDITELENELTVYEQGRQLRSVYGTPVWDLLMQTLEDYSERAKLDLIDLPPGDPTVPTAHAAASALDSLVSHFKQDIAAAIDKAANPSEELRRYLFGVADSMDVAKAMGQ